MSVALANEASSRVGPMCAHLTYQTNTDSSKPCAVPSNMVSAVLAQLNIKHFIFSGEDSLRILCVFVPFVLLDWSYKYANTVVVGG